MLVNGFFNGNNRDLLVMHNILYDFHENGPVNPNHLETLAYLKRFQPKFFKQYEATILFYMGLFYKTPKPKTFIESIYDAYAEAIVNSTGRRFTPPQADAYNNIKRYTNFSFSAPTSAGKSYLFQEIIKEAKRDVIIVIPSRALLSEYLIKVINVVPKETLVLPFIEIVNTSKSKKRVFIITPERGDELFKNINQVDLELILLDEAQLSEEGIRGLKFDSFVRRVEQKFKTAKKVFTHPFVKNPEAQFKKHNITNAIESESYNQNAVGKIYVELVRKNFRFFSPFEDCIKGKLVGEDFVADLIVQGSTVLIYISKEQIYNGSYLDDFDRYISLCDEIKDRKAVSYVRQIEEFLGTSEKDEKHSNLIALMKRGIVIHHGSIPLKVRLLIEEFVNTGYAKICFSTSTLIQGINMPFDAVWIDYFNFKGSEDQKILSLKNLIGRAGRTSADNSFNYGYVVVESVNKTKFIKRLTSVPELSERSALDEVSPSNNEDYIDIVEAIKNDSFDSDLQLTVSQVERISKSDIDNDISFIIDNFFDKANNPITGSQYYQLGDTQRRKIKVAFERIFRAHLRRQDLTTGEKSVLSAAIPILLWQIQGKSFAEIISLRYAFLSEKDFRRDLARQLRSRKIDQSKYDSLLAEKKIRFSCIAHAIPDSNFKKPVALFPGKSVLELDFDKLIYDTYDYIDKVISLSLSPSLIGAFRLYYKKTNDLRSLALANYIKYGTNEEMEIWLLKYGFTFEEIQLMKEHIKAVDDARIVFKDSIEQFAEENPQIKLLKRYI